MRERGGGVKRVERERQEGGKKGERDREKVEGGHCISVSPTSPKNIQTLSHPDETDVKAYNLPEVPTVKTSQSPAADSRYPTTCTIKNVIPPSSLLPVPNKPDGFRGR